MDNDIPTVEEAREAPALTRAARQAWRSRIAPPKPWSLSLEYAE